MNSLIVLISLVVIALVFDFLNGFHDSANVVATMISSRAMSPRAALIIAASANFVGPFIFGFAVAKTVGSEVAAPENVTIAVVFAALISASLWNIITWYFGIPSSSSHALIGGIIGAVLIESGIRAIQIKGIYIIASSLFLSPIVGFIIGLIIMRLMLFAARNVSPKANIFFKNAQIPTALALSLSHGTNDAQKTMGVITMGLIASGYQHEFIVPWWVMIASATAIGLGTAAGGWRIIHTLGGKFYRIRPIHSFSSQLSSAIVIIVASITGGPVSTTHVVSSAILGVGAAQRRSQVRWGVMKEIMVAWLLTVPLTAGVAALVYHPIAFLVK